MVRPKAFAVLRLTISSNFVGSSGFPAIVGYAASGQARLHARALLPGWAESSRTCCRIFSFISIVETLRADSWPRRETPTS